MLLRFCPSTLAMWSPVIGKFHSNATATKKFDEGISGCEGVSCPLKSNSPLSNAEVGDIEDLHDGNSALANL